MPFKWWPFKSDRRRSSPEERADWERREIQRIEREARERAREEADERQLREQEREEIARRLDYYQAFVDYWARHRER